MLICVYPVSVNAMADNATIGDDMSVQYEFEFPDGSVRTSEELGDFEEAGFDWDMGFFVDFVREEHPETEVRMTGFQ